MPPFGIRILRGGSFPLSWEEEEEEEEDAPTVWGANLGTAAWLGRTAGVVGSPAQGQADGHDPPIAAPQLKNLSAWPTSAGNGAQAAGLGGLPVTPR